MLEGVYFLSEGRLFADTPADDGPIFECHKLNCFSYRVYSRKFFFKIGIHSMQGWTATMRYGVTWKEAQKRLQDTENLFRKNLQLKDVC